MNEDELRRWLRAEVDAWTPDELRGLDGYSLGEYHAFQEVLERLEGGAA